MIWGGLEGSVWDDLGVLGDHFGTTLVIIWCKGDQEDPRAYLPPYQFGKYGKGTFSRKLEFHTSISTKLQNDQYETFRHSSFFDRDQIAGGFLRTSSNSTKPVRNQFGKYDPLARPGCPPWLGQGAHQYE